MANKEEEETTKLNTEEVAHENEHIIGKYEHVCIVTFQPNSKLDGKGHPQVLAKQTSTGITPGPTLYF